MYLSETEFQRFDACSMRSFKEGECHITRLFNKSVLILMFSGILKFSEDGKDVSLGVGEYYIQRQGLYQEGRTPCDKPVYFYIHFDGAFSEKAGIPLRGRFSRETTLPYIRLLESRFPLRDKNSFALNGLFYNILGCLQQEKTLPRDADTANLMITYAAARCSHSDFSVRELAERFSYSENSVIRIFRDNFDITPYKYITRLRMERAKQQLLNSADSLTDIARKCGYEDYSVFYKMFIRETGCSPGRWREDNALSISK